jgi:hypothetical protein
VNVEEITRCAQDTLNQKLTQFPDILGQHMTIGGNKAFIPTFQVAGLSAAPEAVPTAQPPAVATSVEVAPPASALAPSLPAPSSQAVKPAELLAQIHAQRDASRALEVSANPSVLRIQQDPLRLKIQSPRNGYLYIALAGSDQKSLYLLFPNSLDGNNVVQANQTIELPRANWRVTAGGPKGVNTVLVMVSDSPRDVSQLAGQKAGPFVKPLLDQAGKSQLNTLLGLSENSDQTVCQQGGRKRNLNVEQEFSDGFASALIRLEEVDAR